MATREATQGRQSTQDTWGFVSGSLSIDSLLIIDSDIVWFFVFENVSVRDRAFAVSDALGIVPAILALGATLTFLVAQHPRWSLLLARFSAVMVGLATLYGLWYSAAVSGDLPQSGWT